MYICIHIYVYTALLLLSNRTPLHQHTPFCIHRDRSCSLLRTVAIFKKDKVQFMDVRNDDIFDVENLRFWLVQLRDQITDVQNDSVLWVCKFKVCWSLKLEIHQKEP